MSTIFLLGATGYVGGSVLTALRDQRPDLEITALVRNPAHAGAIRATGASVIPGSFGDAKLVEDQVYAHDVVINTADSNNVKLMEAILRGARRRYDEGKKQSVLVHTSGVAVLLDGGREGKFDMSGKIWNDAKEDDLKSITNSMHGQVDVREHINLKLGGDGPSALFNVAAASARVVADRLKELGWKARLENLEIYMKVDVAIVSQ
ncbi:hypothetical protein FA95DRAFT_1600200 [Auriscalpium vulgare]|uniref:Uncharacterized protein n=1 Tax=Auriscalpium vulgare TaxID=40419 RepID=A0ACB8R2I0_9AGAM|nr:hypothetical protein FA95DRAFT_1600200 [Auriscalpium vulgare]